MSKRIAFAHIELYYDFSTKEEAINFIHKGLEKRSFFSIYDRITHNWAWHSQLWFVPTSELERYIIYNDDCFSVNVRTSYKDYNTGY